MTKSDKDMLESLFEDARATPPAVPSALMDRILKDAAAEQPTPGPRGWRGLWHAIGGGPALGGLVTATAVGFWIGVAPPSGMPDFAAALMTGNETETIDVATDSGADLSAFGWDIEEL